MWCPPSEIPRVTPRNIAAATTFKLVMASLLVVVSALTIYVASDQVEVFYRWKILKYRGVDVYAEVTNTYQTTRKSFTTNHVEYIFSPEGEPSDKTFQGHGALSDREFYTVYNGGQIQIIYDPINPDRSLPNIGDVVRFRRAPSVVSLVLPAMIPFCMGAALVIYISVKYYREKRLLQWGGLAPATILSEEEYSSRSGRWSRITYAFLDSKGNTIEGTRNFVPVKGDERQSFADLRKQILDNPTILFDPQDPLVNILYPPSVVKLKK